jgi:hypothetical protein
MAKGSLKVVRKNLQAYADRGVFRGFCEVESGQFEFVWLIRRQMRLSVDTEANELRFKQLLPGIPAGSALYAELKGFVKERQAASLPSHRRVDTRRAEVSCFNRRGFVSISLKVKNNQYAYGVNRIVNLIHEIFLHLRDAHPDYLSENFDVPQE